MHRVPAFERGPLADRGHGRARDLGDSAVRPQPDLRRLEECLPPAGRHVARAGKRALRAAVPREQRAHGRLHGLRQRRRSDDQGGLAAGVPESPRRIGSRARRRADRSGRPADSRSASSVRSRPSHTPAAASTTHEPAVGAAGDWTPSLPVDLEFSGWRHAGKRLGRARAAAHRRGKHRAARRLRHAERTLQRRRSDPGQGRSDLCDHQLRECAHLQGDGGRCQPDHRGSGARQHPVPDVRHHFDVDRHVRKHAVQPERHDAQRRSPSGPVPRAVRRTSRQQRHADAGAEVADRSERRRRARGARRRRRDDEAPVRRRQQRRRRHRPVRRRRRRHGRESRRDQPDPARHRLAQGAERARRAC